MSEILRYSLSNPRRLPLGYIPLAYIESTSDGDIVTSMKFNNGWKTIMKCIPPTAPTNSYRLFGLNNNSNAWYAGSNSVYWSNPITWEGTFPKGLHTTIDMAFYNNSSGKICCYIKDNFGTNISHTTTNTNTDTSNLYIGGRLGMKIYRVTTWDYYDGTLGSIKGDFVPCMNSSTSLCGLFDLVTQTFYGNSGSGSFIGGPELQPLDPAYQQVEYLQMPTGSYVNTGFNIESGNVVKTEATMWYATGGSGRDLMGWSTNGANYWGVTAAGAWEKVTGTNSDITKRLSVSYLYTADRTNGSLPYQIGALTNLYMTRTKYIERFKISIGGVLKRDYIPCYLKSDMVPGLYDLITGEFKVNSGSSSFLLGPSLPSSGGLVEWNGGAGPIKGFSAAIETDLTKWGKESGVSVTKDTNSNLYKVTDSSHTSSRWGIYKDVTLEANTTYTMFVPTAKGTNTAYTWIGKIPSGGSFPSSNSTTNSGNEEVKYITFTTDDTTAIRIYMGFYPTATGQYAYFACPRIVKGTWTSEPTWLDYVGIPHNLHSSPLHPSGTCHNLPVGYLEVEYVEAVLSSSGSLSYIDTGVVDFASATDAVEYTCMVTASGSASVLPLFGCRLSGSCNANSLWIGNSNKYYIPLSAGDCYSSTLGLNNKVTFKRNVGGDGYIGSEKVGTISGSDTGHILMMIAAASGTTATPDFRHSYTIRSYECKIWKSGALVRHFIPCIQTGTTPVVGMYDVVNRLFYSSATSKALSCGPAIGRNEGSTEMSNYGYLNCGTVLNGMSMKNTTSSLWFCPKNISGSKMIYGTQHGSNQRYYVGRVGDKYAFGIANSGWDALSTAPAVVGLWVHLAVATDSSGNARLYYNGTLVLTKSTSVNFSGVLLIGCGNANESYAEGYYYDFRFFNEYLDADKIKAIYLAK